MRKSVTLLLILTIMMAAIIPCLSGVSAENVNLIYGGEGEPLSDEWPPTIALKTTNDSYIYFYSDKNISLKDNEPLNLSLSVSAGKSPNGRAIGLFDVSYNASWLQYPVVLYHWNGNPADFDVWYQSGPQYSLDYNLTLNNIPKGNQSIEFKVTSIGMYIGIPYFSSFKKEATMTLNLSVGNPTVTKEPVSLTLIIIVSLALLFVVSAGLLVYFKKRKR